MYYIRLLTFLLLFLSIIPAYAMAAPISMIRDTEVENTVRSVATPVFNAAGLKAKDIRIFLVNDPQINAFVAGGMNLFINTGLLMEFENPNVLQGVIAHETGHIAGGHLARGSERYREATVGTAIGYVLGAVAAAGGSPQAGMAIIAGGSHINQQEMLQFSRENEQAADQAGLTFLDRTHTSAKGLLALLEFLGRKEKLAYGEVDPYRLTHPLSRERVTHIRNHTLGSPYQQTTVSPALQEQYARSHVKLKAFLDSPAVTLKHYPTHDQTMLAHYARAIAYYRQPDMGKALQEVDILIKTYPKDPYFYELKGQMLFENGRVKEAVSPYDQAVALMPDAALLQLGLAMAQIAAAPDDNRASGKGLLELAVKHLLIAYRIEPNNMPVIQQLVIAYGRQGEFGMSYLFQAEEMLLRNNKDQAKRFAERAKKTLPSNSTYVVRANDILNSISNKKEKIFDLKKSNSLRLSGIGYREKKDFLLG